MAAVAHGAAIDAALAGLAATQAQHTAALAGLTATQAQHTGLLGGLAATQAQHTAALAGLTATQAQHTGLLGGVANTLAQMQAQLAQMQAQLAPLNVAAVAGAASRVVQATAAARARNLHDRRGVPLSPVPREDGSQPPNWPAGFDRDELHDGAIGTVDLLLGDYGLANGAGAGTLIERRNMLAGVIGTMLF